MKQWIKRTARKLGAHLHTGGSLPKGADWLFAAVRLDLQPAKRLCFDVGADTGQAPHASS